MKHVFVAAVLALAVGLTVAPSASASRISDSRLDAIASDVAGKPVSVWCETSKNDYADMQRAQGFLGDTDGWTYFAEPVVYIAPDLCTTLRALLAPRAHGAVGPYWASRAIKVLIHEGVHQRGDGIADEALTECLALKSFKHYLPRFGYRETIESKQTLTVKRRVVRHGRVVMVKRKQSFSVTRPNPEIDKLYGWAKAWSAGLPEQYHGATC